MKTSLTIVFALVLACVCADLAHAEGDGPGRQGKRGRHGKHKAGQLFDRFDKNGDGALTADEVPERLWTRISKADADGDGSVTKAEAKAFAKGHHGKRGRGGRHGKRGGGQCDDTDA